MKKRIKLWMARILVMILVVTQIQPIPVHAMEIGDATLSEVVPENATEATEEVVAPAVSEEEKAVTSVRMVTMPTKTEFYKKIEQPGDWGVSLELTFSDGTTLVLGKMDSDWYQYISPHTLYTDGSVVFTEADGSFPIGNFKWEYRVIGTELVCEVPFTVKELSEVPFLVSGTEAQVTASQDAIVKVDITEAGTYMFRQDAGSGLAFYNSTGEFINLNQDWIKIEKFEAGTYYMKILNSNTFTTVTMKKVPAVTDVELQWDGSATHYVGMSILEGPANNLKVKLTYENGTEIVVKPGTAEWSEVGNGFSYSYVDAVTGEQVPTNFSEDRTYILQMHDPYNKVTHEIAFEVKHFTEVDEVLTLGEKVGPLSGTKLFKLEIDEQGTYCIKDNAGNGMGFFLFDENGVRLYGDYLTGDNTVIKADLEKRTYYAVCKEYLSNSSYSFVIDKELNKDNVSHILTLDEELKLKSEYVNQKTYVKVYCPEAGQYSVFMDTEEPVDCEVFDTDFESMGSTYGQYCAFGADTPGYYYIQIDFEWNGREVTLSMEKLVPLTGITLHEDGYWEEYYGVTNSSYYLEAGNYKKKSYTMEFQDGTSVTADLSTWSKNEVAEKYGIRADLVDLDGNYVEEDEYFKIPIGVYYLRVANESMKIFDQKQFVVHDKAEITKELKNGQTVTGFEGNGINNYVKVTFEEPGVYGFKTDGSWVYIQGICDENNKQISVGTNQLDGVQMEVKEPGTYYMCFIINVMNATSTYSMSLEKVKIATGIKVLSYNKTVYEGCYLNNFSGLNILYELTFEDGTKETFGGLENLAFKYNIVNTVYRKDDLENAYYSGATDSGYSLPAGEYVLRIEPSLSEIHNCSCEIEFSVVPLDAAPMLVFGEEASFDTAEQLYRVNIPKDGTYTVTFEGKGWIDAYSEDERYISACAYYDSPIQLELTEGICYLRVYNRGYSEKLPIKFAVFGEKSLEITKQPENVTVNKGENASVSVSANGNGLKYQWYYTSNGKEDIFYKSSNTTNTYTTAMDESKDGRKVYCVVTDKDGNKVTSNTVTLNMKVVNVLKITKQPEDVTVNNGATASVSVAASGEGLKYQWYYTSNGSASYFNKSSNTTNTYSTAMDATRDGRKVYCVVTDKDGNKVTSNTVTLSMKVDNTLKITKQPADVTVNNGATATVSVEASGEGLKYQWYYTSNGTTSYFNKSSNTTNTYSTAMDATRDGRKVYCVVTDKDGNKVTSNTVTLNMKVDNTLKITKQPEDVTVNNGATATVSVEASGEGLKYQWYYTSNGSTSYFNKSSNTTNTYSTAMDATRDGRKVYCVVTDKDGNKVTSNTVTLGMKGDNVLTITKQPADVTVASGVTATVSVTANGDGLKYQWYYTSNGSTSYFNKSSNTTNTYSTAMDATRDGRKVYCVVTDKDGNKVTSNTVTLKMNTTATVKITKQPVDVSASKGATASVSVTASGEGLKYQWYYTSNGSTSYFNKSSNTTNTYSTSMDATRDGRKVYCVVTDEYGNKVTSNTVSLNMSK